MKKRVDASIDRRANRRKRQLGSQLRFITDFRGIVEHLEKRTLLSAITWNGGTGNWNTPSNWTPTQVPSGADNVTIPSGANVTISDNEAADTVTTAAGSSLTIQSSGELNLTGSGGTIGGSLDWAGIITGNGQIGSLTLAGTTTFTGTADQYPVINNGTVNANDGQLQGTTFTNNGTLNITNGLGLEAGLNFTNSSSGTINITDSTGFNPSNPAAGFSANFFDDGTLNWAGSGTSMVPSGVYFVNSGGTLNITSGNVTVVGAAAFESEQIQVASGSTLAFNNGSPGSQYNTNITFGGTITGSGAGKIELDSGDFYAGGPNEASSDGTLNLPQGMLQVGNVQIGQAGGTLTNTGYMTFFGSTFGLATFNNNGTIISTASGSLFFNHVNNAVGATVDFQGDGGITSEGGGFNNSGTLEKTGGAGKSVIGGYYFNNAGALNIQTGTLSYQVGTTGFIAGPITIASGAVLNFAGTNGIYIQGTLASTGGGTVTVTSGWLDGPDPNVNENPAAAASLDFAPNTLYFEGGDIESDQQTNLINTGAAYFQNASPISQMENTGTINIDGTQHALPKGSIITNDATGTIIVSGAASFVTGVNCDIDNAGLIQLDPGGSNTIDLATPFPADFVRERPGIVNTGTIEVMSGTVKFPTISFGALHGNIDQGTYQVDSGASLISDTADNITTNNGTVILNGTAFFPDIASLATNNGGFTVGQGATFSTAGSLTNTGTLTVGGSLTVNGNLTESGSNTALAFAISGAPGGNGAPSLNVTGNTTLAGNLTATLANGFAGSSGTSYTVANFTNAAGGSFASTAGVGPNFTVTVNPTSIVFNSTGSVSTSAVDLNVTSVTGVTDGSPGSTENISWNVTNEGPGAISGPWRDSVYLTTNGVIDSNSILLGRVDESAALASGASYTGTLAATLPVLPVATYKIVVLVDSGKTLSDSNRANNVGVSGPFVTTVPTLTLNAANKLTIAPGQQLLYRLIVPAGGDVSLGITFPSIDVGFVYTSFNAIPTVSSSDESFAHGFAVGSLLLPVHQAGSYYILVQGTTDITSPQNFTLTPTRISGLNVQSVTPAQISNAPNSTFTLTITGSGFNANTTASIVLESTTINSQTVTLVDVNTIEATFQLPAANPTQQDPAGTLHTGNYDVDVANGDTTASLPQGLNMFNYLTGGTSSGLEYSLVFPSLSRGDLNNTVYLDYENGSNSDIAAPYFVVFGDNTSFKLADQSGFSDAAIEIFGGATSGLAGTLLPGEGGSIPITYTQTTIEGHQEATLEVAWVDSLPGFDASSLMAAAQPANEPNDTWAAITANFEAMVVADPNSLTGVLRNAANALSLTGVYTSDPQVLMDYAIQEAGDFGAIDQRYYLGAFGRGQSDPYAVAAAADSNGNVTITDGGQERLFIKQTNGTYDGIDGDAATLSLANSVYTLTDTGGEVSVFNTDGTLNYLQDTNGNRVTYNYTSGILTSITASDGDTYTFTYDANGRITQVTDPEGRSTAYTYDSTDQLLQSVTNVQGTTSFTYYSGSDLADLYAVTSITYLDGSTRDYTYDDMGRLTSQQWSDGSDKFAYAYDNLGRQTTTDALGNTSTLILSAPDGGTASIIDALGNIARIAYNSNGQITSQTSPSNDATTTAYNSAGDTTSITDPLGNTTSFTYDSTLNLLLTLTDPAGNQTTFAYDSHGNLTTVTDAAGYATTNTFNSAGELASSTSAAGRSVAITYTSFGAVASRTYADSSTVTYTYDSHRNLISAADSLNGAITYTYNSADRLTSVTQPGGLSLAYTYNANGQLISETDQTGYTTDYTYNAAGQITQITNGSGAGLTTYTYDPAGNLIKTTNANGTSAVYTYNVDNFVATITNYSPTHSVDSKFIYTYDANGNRITQTTTDGTTDYTYDADNQLIKAILPGGRTITYAYDANGNRTTVSDTALTSVTYSVNNLDEYVTVGGTTYGYDHDGNLISSSTGGVTTTYTYNDRDQLASADVGGVIYTYSYDAIGKQTGVTSNGVTTDYLIDPTGIGNIAGAFTTGGAVLDHYIYGNGLVGAVDAAGNDSFYDFDAAGNTANITNAAGTVSNTYTYLPFGEILSSSGGANLFTFGGQYGAQNTGDGLYTMRAREYDPAIGRFTQRDPINIASGDANLYRYGGNNPLNYVDPTGTTLVAAAADGLVFLAQNGYLPLTAAENLSAGLLGNVARNAAVESVGAFTSTLAANTGTIFTASGEFAADAVFTVTPLTAAEAAPLVIPEGAAVFTGTTTSVTFTGSVAQASAAAIFSTAAIATTAILAPIAYTAANNYLHSHYPDGFPVPVQNVINPVAFQKTLQKPLIQRLVEDFIKDNGHPPDQQQLNTLIAYANSVDGGNANSFILTHGSLLGLTDYLNANDPNDLIGPAGFGSPGFIQDGGIYPYEITFENEPTASAPAKIVTISEQLDSNLDWTTFQLGTITFGSHTVTVPAGLMSYNTTVSISDTLSVNIVANFDQSTGLLTYTFTSIDPNTGDVPSGALDGFLPPDDSAGDGYGTVSYTVNPKSSLANNTAISAVATIVFDNNAPLNTPTALNTIDAVAPTSSVNALPRYETAGSFTVTWSGTDSGGSGIASYEIYVAEDGGSFTPWLLDTTNTSAVFSGAVGHEYAFYSIATDSVGNVEATPVNPQATTADVIATRTINFTGKTKATYTDSQGHTVTIFLSGPGSGTIGFIADNPADPVLITLTGTTSKTTLNIVVQKGQFTTINNIQVNGSLGKFNGTAVNLAGSIDITGTLGSLTAHAVTGIVSSIEVDGASVATSYKFGAIQNLTLTSASPIKSFTATSWTSTNGVADSLTAPSISSIKISGNFDANITLSASGPSLGTFSAGAITGGKWSTPGSIKSLSANSISNAVVSAASIATLKVKGNFATDQLVLTAAPAKTADLASFSVGGAVSNSQIRSAGNIGKVTVGSMASSIFFAGVSSAVTALPTSASDFSAQASIASFIDKGAAAFSDSQIAAETIDVVQLHNVATNNGGTPFGVAAHALKSFALNQPDSKPFIWTSKQPPSALSNLPGDLKVSLL